jgi:hypothetical protein
MNAKLLLKDVQVAEQARIGELNISVEYTADEFIALMKSYPDMLKSLMEIVKS